MLTKRCLRWLLGNLAEQDDLSPLRVAYACVVHAHEALTEQAIVPKASSLVALLAVGNYLFHSGGVEACRLAALLDPGRSFYANTVAEAFDLATYHLVVSATCQDTQRQECLTVCLREACAAASCVRNDKWQRPEEVWQTKRLVDAAISKPLAVGLRGRPSLLTRI
jgi:hypothetical protein